MIYILLLRHLHLHFMHIKIGLLFEGKSNIYTWMREYEQYFIYGAQECSARVSILVHKVKERDPVTNI